MIRFINLNGQIEDNEQCFAFYDTVDDCFVSLDGYQVFDTKEFFIDMFNQNGYKNYSLERFVNLIHSNITVNIASTPKNFDTEEYMRIAKRTPISFSKLDSTSIIRLHNIDREDESYFTKNTIIDDMPFVTGTRIMLRTNRKFKKNGILELQNKMELFATDESAQINKDEYATIFQLITNDMSIFVPREYLNNNVLFNIIN